MGLATMSDCVWRREDAYALPSTILLITVLSFVAASLVSVQYFRRQLAQIEMSRTKAEYATESGLAEVFSQMRTLRDLRLEAAIEIAMEDGSACQVAFSQWGLFSIARSTGLSHRIRVARTALVAQVPTSHFENALMYGTPGHQLVMAGESMIRGNVVVGQSGVTTGTLRGRRTPPRIPIEGRVQRSTSVEIPAFDTLFLDQLRQQVRSALERARRQPRQSETMVVQLNEISDTATNIFLRGDVALRGQITRRSNPLAVAVSGRVTISSTASMQGLMAVFADRNIVVSPGASIEHAILVSADSLVIKPGTSICAQCVSPCIQIDSGCTLSYPSFVLSSLIHPNDSVKQKITIGNDALVEGSVIVRGPRTTGQQDVTGVLAPRAKIVGAFYSDSGVTTLDGVVLGTVMVREFYFYEAPTSYFGWIRSGTIDRTHLPNGFLLPLGFSGTTQMEVLDWL